LEVLAAGVVTNGKGHAAPAVLIVPAVLLWRGRLAALPAVMLRCRRPQIDTPSSPHVLDQHACVAACALLLLPGRM
jgi:hypothetical protein